MSTRHIALVPEMGVNASELARVSAALQKQVTRDVSPIWGVSATVDAFPHIEDVPTGYWPLVLTYRDLGSDAGVRMDASGQPYAVVEMSPSWSLTASHVCLELICDPFGNRMFAGPSPRPDQGQVEFLAGICDPCEDAAYAYVVNDVLVSDFCTPAFWEPASARERYSFTGAVQAPFEVLPGGHLRWYDPATLNWWIRRVTDNTPADRNLGRADQTKKSVREFLDARAPHHLLSTKMTVDAFEARMGARHRQSLQASQSRAFSLRASFGHPRHEAEDSVQVVHSSGRQQVFGALRRASLGSGTTAKEFPVVQDDEIARTNGDANQRGETVSASDVEEMPASADMRQAAPQTAALRRQQREQAAPTTHRTFPPPLPQTSVAPPSPQTSAPPAAGRPSTISPSLAPFSWDSSEAERAYRNRMFAFVGIAAAFVLGIGIHRLLTTPATASTQEAGAALQAQAPAPQPVAPAAQAAAPAPQPVAPAPQPVVPAAQAAVPVPQPVVPAAQALAPAPQAAAPVRPATPTVVPVAQRPTKRATRTVEPTNQDELENLIDDRR